MPVHAPHSRYPQSVPMQSPIQTSTVSAAFQRNGFAFKPESGLLAEGRCCEKRPVSSGCAWRAGRPGWRQGSGRVLSKDASLPGASGIWHLPQGLMGSKTLEGLQTRSCHCRTPTPRAFPLGQQPLGLRRGGPWEVTASPVLRIRAFSLGAPHAHGHGHPVEVLAPRLPPWGLDGDGAVRGAAAIGRARGGCA